MKKIILGILVIFAVFIISGCVSDTRNQVLLKVLKQNDVIKKDWKLKDKVKGRSIKENNKTFMLLYIYQNKNNEMFGVEISPDSEDKDGTTKYNATVYDSITKDDSNSKIFKKNEIKELEKVYYYSDDKSLRDLMIYKYNSNNKKKYLITYTKGMLFNEYQVLES